MKTRMVYVPKTGKGYIKGFHRMTAGEEATMLRVTSTSPSKPNEVEEDDPKRSSKYDVEEDIEAPRKKPWYAQDVIDNTPRERTEEELKRAENARIRAAYPDPPKTISRAEQTRARAFSKAATAGMKLEEIDGRVLLNGIDRGGVDDRFVWSKILYYCIQVHDKKVRELRKSEVKKTIRRRKR